MDYKVCEKLARPSGSKYQCFEVQPAACEKQCTLGLDAGVTAIQHLHQ